MHSFYSFRESFDTACFVFLVSSYLSRTSADVFEDTVLVMDILEEVMAIRMGMVGMVAQLMALEVGHLMEEALAAALVVIRCLILGLG